MRPSTVAAIASVMGAFDLLAPLLVGWIADFAGVFAAAAFLMLQPITVLTAGLVARRVR